MGQIGRSAPQPPIPQPPAAPQLGSQAVSHPQPGSSTTVAPQPASQPASQPKSHPPVAQLNRAPGKPHPTWPVQQHPLAKLILTKATTHNIHVRIIEVAPHSSCLPEPPIGSCLSDIATIRIFIGQSIRKIEKIVITRKVSLRSCYWFPNFAQHTILRLEWMARWLKEVDKVHFPFIHRRSRRVSNCKM
jgi:hypothetical protein